MASVTRSCRTMPHVLIPWHYYAIKSSNFDVGCNVPDSYEQSSRLKFPNNLLRNRVVYARSAKAVLVESLPTLPQARSVPLDDFADSLAASFDQRVSGS